MLKIILFFGFLSVLFVDSQKIPKDFPHTHRDGIEISDLSEVKPYQESPLNYRLPNTSYPNSYFINLDFGDFHKNELTFKGSVLIPITFVESSNTITLHCSVNVTEVILVSKNNIISQKYSLDSIREFLIVEYDVPFNRDDTVLLTVEYNGVIGSTYHGIYRGSYLNDESETRYFIATHMQPTFARRVFPCYDEPSFKAQFSLSINHNADFKAHSNMMETLLHTNGSVITNFEMTPLLSTYLIAFVISDFDMNSKTSANNVLFRAFSRPEQIQNTNFGLYTAERALEGYESAFKTKYSVAKLDQVALPEFRVGGMENNAIIFYREKYFLYDANVTTAYDKEFAAATIVHEVCHKFLGNLMTPAWWSVLWLSEGFCRFYEYYMTEKIYPAMRMEELFAVEVTQSILYQDSTLSTRPMTWYEESPDAVGLLFDGIAYSKSASVIRMFFYVLSDTIFHKGLEIYLSKQTNPPGVAEPKDLYDALQLAVENDPEVTKILAGHNIEELFGSWENQAGYPWLYVERSYNSPEIKFIQNRFTDNVADDLEWNSKWYIPISYATKFDTAHDAKPKFWMKPEREQVKELDELTPDSYLLVNVNQIGYYRVQYDVANWMLIANELSRGNYSTISPNSRAMLIDDAAVFFENNMLHVRIFLELIKYLEHDIDYIPWMAATNNLIYMRRMLDNGNKLSEDFRAFLQILLTKTFNTFGVKEKEDEPHFHKHIRNIGINWACRAHLPSCLNDTRDLFNEFMEGERQGFSSDHEAAIFCNGLRTAGEHEFDFMFNLFNSTIESSRRLLYLESMGCVENKELLTRFIEMIIESDDIHDSEWLTIMQAIYDNGPIGLRVAFNFLRNNASEIIGFLQEIKSDKLESIFRGMAKRVNSEKLQDDLNDLLVIYSCCITNDIVKEIRAITGANLYWLTEYSSDIQDFLNDFLRNGSSASSTFSCFIIMFGLVFNWIMQN